MKDSFLGENSRVYVKESMNDCVMGYGEMELKIYGIHISNLQRREAISSQILGYKKPNRRREPFSEASERQVKIDANENQVVNKPVENTTVLTLSMGESRQLSVRVVQRIGANVE